MGELNEWMALQAYCKWAGKQSVQMQYQWAFFFFLPALGNFPAKAVTLANYAYTSVDCVNLWLYA